MKIKIKMYIILVIGFVLILTGCGKKNVLSDYDVEGLNFIAYSDIDSVCENDDLITAGQNLLELQSDSLYLSYVMDSAIELTNELGEYDHLVFTNSRWIERFGNVDKLKSVDFNSLTNEMKIFLQEQMPLLTVDGSVLPDGTMLFTYQDNKFLSFPVSVTLGGAEAIEAKKPLNYFSGKSY
ncbi:MAG: DUF6619 domain-containing protein [Peptostreptococcaceae bacterium]